MLWIEEPIMMTARASTITPLSSISAEVELFYNLLTNIVQRHAIIRAEYHTGGPHLQIHGPLAISNLYLSCITNYGYGTNHGIDVYCRSSVDWSIRNGVITYVQNLPKGRIGGS